MVPIDVRLRWVKDLARVGSSIERGTLIYATYSSGISFLSTFVDLIIPRGLLSVDYCSSHLGLSAEVVHVVSFLDLRSSLLSFPSSSFFLSLPFGSFCHLCFPFGLMFRLLPCSLFLFSPQLFLHLLSSLVLFGFESSILLEVLTSSFFLLELLLALSFDHFLHCGAIIFFFLFLYLSRSWFHHLRIRCLFFFLLLLLNGLLLLSFRILSRGFWWRSWFGSLRKLW